MKSTEKLGIIILYLCALGMLETSIPLWIGILIIFGSLLFIWKEKQG